jgi:DNA-binding transcriptional ArsR family regulator
MEPRLDILGAALADQSRSRILCELMDGRAFTNKELACAANVTAQTASAHLKHLEAVGFTTSLRSGRNVYHRIANADVASALEALGNLSPTEHLHRAKNRRMPEADTMLARSCYNHIAGRLGVLIADRLFAMNVLRKESDAVSLDPEGRTFFRKLSIDVPQQSSPLKLCLDWTERRHHLSGPLATKTMEHAFKMNWLERRDGTRALKITAQGYEVFARVFSLSRDQIDDTACDSVKIEAL